MSNTFEEMANQASQYSEADPSEDVVVETTSPVVADTQTAAEAHKTEHVSTPARATESVATSNNVKKENTSSYSNNKTLDRENIKRVIDTHKVLSDSFNQQSMEVLELLIEAQNGSSESVSIDWDDEADVISKLIGNYSEIRDIMYHVIAVKDMIQEHQPLDAAVYLIDLRSDSITESIYTLVVSSVDDSASKPDPKDTTLAKMAQTIVNGIDTALDGDGNQALKEQIPDFMATYQLLSAANGPTIVND